MKNHTVTITHRESLLDGDASRTCTMQRSRANGTMTIELCEALKHQRRAIRHTMPAPTLTDVAKVSGQAACVEAIRGFLREAAVILNGRNIPDGAPVPAADFHGEAMANTTADRTGGPTT